MNITEFADMINTRLNTIRDTMLNDYNQMKGALMSEIREELDKGIQAELSEEIQNAFSAIEDAINDIESCASTIDCKVDTMMAAARDMSDAISPF